ncbi:MAG: alpha-L-rhamnosidase C-terminal domain-containing protein, partial [Oscillospiraceae bacterium]|nr:alpha-L-rhamnosidase C-terminal domain-containing protein [Oscillospiraceae bacterium]
ANGLVESDRQCDYVRPLEFGLLDREEENASRLNELVVQNDYHLNTGFLATPFLCPVLCRFGYVDTAYRLLLQKTNPSWLYQVRKGATTIWESWNGLEDGGNASLNHYSYGAVSGWLVSGICGINVDAGKLTIRPYPDSSLDFACASYTSVLGTVKSSWRNHGDELEYEFEIPANVEAEVIFPNGEKETLTWGKHNITK